MHQVCEALTLIQNTNDKIHVLADALLAWDSDKVELTDEHVSKIGHMLFDCHREIEQSTKKIKDRSK